MITGRQSFQTSLRLPDGMHPLLSERAERNGRSLNSEIVQILYSALRSATAATGASFAGNAPAAASDETALQGGPIHQRS